MSLQEITEKVVLLSPSDRLALVQVIISSLQVIDQIDLSNESRDADFNFKAEVSSAEIKRLAMAGNSFQFLEGEPDIYTLEDGMPI